MSNKSKVIAQFQYKDVRGEPDEFITISTAMKDDVMIERRLHAPEGKVTARIWLGPEEQLKLRDALSTILLDLS